MWLTLRSTYHKYSCIEWSCKYGVSDKTAKALWFRPGFEIKLLKKSLFKNYRHWSGNHFWRTLVDSSLWMAIVIRGTWNTATGYRNDHRKIWFTAPIFFSPARPATRIRRHVFANDIFCTRTPSRFHHRQRFTPCGFFGDFNLSVRRDVAGWRDTRKPFGQL